MPAELRHRGAGTGLDLEGHWYSPAAPHLHLPEGAVSVVCLHCADLHAQATERHLRLQRNSVAGGAFGAAQGSFASDDVANGNGADAGTDGRIAAGGAGILRGSTAPPAGAPCATRSRPKVPGTWTWNTPAAERPWNASAGAASRPPTAAVVAVLQMQCTDSDCSSDSELDNTGPPTNPKNPAERQAASQIFPRMPSEMLAEQPVYVNAKQHQRIMVRRQARQRAEQLRGARAAGDGSGAAAAAGGGPLRHGGGGRGKGKGLGRKPWAMRRPPELCRGGVCWLRDGRAVPPAEVPVRAAALLSGRGLLRGVRRPVR